MNLVPSKNKKYWHLAKLLGKLGSYVKIWAYYVFDHDSAIYWPISLKHQETIVNRFGPFLRENGRDFYYNCNELMKNQFLIYSKTIF